MKAIKTQTYKKWIIKRIEIKLISGYKYNNYKWAKIQGEIVIQ
jgi:hypothetical protein